MKLELNLSQAAIVVDALRAHVKAQELYLHGTRGPSPQHSQLDNARKILRDVEQMEARAIDKVIA